MKLVFLGTSGAHPTSKRGLSCVCLITDGEILMFDAGEGAQISYLKSGLGWNKKMKIFITHMHGDHCIGVLGLLQTMSLQKRTEPVEIFGPEGIDEFISENIRILNFGLPFPVLITVIDSKTVIDGPKYNVSVCSASHSVLAFSYRFTEKDRPGRFFLQKAQELNIPEGELWGKLQNGDSITINGNTILPSQVLGDMRPGRIIGISGDTRPTEKLEEFFKACDYLVFDSTFLDELKYRAEDTYHSTAAEAATLAKNAGVKNLILTHFSARYDDELVLVEEAKKIHDSVIAASDLLKIEIV